MGLRFTIIFPKGLSTPYQPLISGEVALFGGVCLDSHETKKGEKRTPTISMDDSGQME